MNQFLDTDVDPREERRTPGTSADREISLGAPTILGIFFALALVCAGFFGFGYTEGRKSAQSAPPIVAASPANGAVAAKPTAGTTSASVPIVASATPMAVPAPSVTMPMPSPRNAVSPADTMIVGDKFPTRVPPPAANVAQPAGGSSQPAISPGGAFMVQIAAVSSQSIADIELTALKRYGYDVVVRHEPQDSLLHIQIGPYATRKDAEAMRQNVQANGFNAIVK